MEDVREGGESSSSSSRDVRRFFCDFCGICRSKRSLIHSHILAHHQDEAEFSKYDAHARSTGERPDYQCTECGVSFRKPAYLRQHMQCHSLERPFVCPVDDCQHSYRRKDHLARHLLQHEGKMFSCPVDHCGRQFTLLGNMQRHVREVHDDDDHDDDDDSCSSDGQSQSQHHHVCPESGCGKSFRYQSRLKKHMGLHVNLEYVDVICCEPGCMQHFTNAECLKAHIQTSHQHIECPICGTKQLRKNIKRHMRTHEKETTSERIKCPFPRCLHTFSRKSNLTKHIRAVHEELRPFICRFPGCGQRFPYKHVRDNHEKSGVHTYVEGDFLVSDEQFLARSRGRKKREQPPPVGSLLRKRIAATPEEDSTHRLRRLLESLG